MRHLLDTNHVDAIQDDNALLRMPKSEDLKGLKKHTAFLLLRNLVTRLDSPQFKTHTSRTLSFTETRTTQPKRHPRVT